MKRFYLVAIALVALFALGNAGTASATVCSAEARFLNVIPKYENITACENMTPRLREGLWVLLWRWRQNGAEITTLLSSETVGELKLTAEGEPIIGTVEVTCSGILDGTVSPGGEDEVTELLSLSGEAISLTGLSGTALSCTNTSKCATPLVWAIGLPYKSELLAEEENETTKEILKPLDETSATEIGYEVQCMGVLGEPSDTCKQTKVTGTLENMTGENVLASVKEIKTSNCATAGANKGSIESVAPGEIKLLTGTLSIG
jgi:hypothetical protein